MLPPEYVQALVAQLHGLGGNSWMGAPMAQWMPQGHIPAPMPYGPHTGAMSMLPPEHMPAPMPYGGPDAMAPPPVGSPVPVPGNAMPGIWGGTGLGVLAPGSAMPDPVPAADPNAYETRGWGQPNPGPYAPTPRAPHLPFLRQPPLFRTPAPRYHPFVPVPAHRAPRFGPGY